MSENSLFVTGIVFTGVTCLGIVFPSGFETESSWKMMAFTWATVPLALWLIINFFENYSINLKKIKRGVEK